MSNYTFPTQEQYFEDREMLEVIKKKGTKAAITDFSILLGGWVNTDSDYWHIDSDDSLAGRTGYYWTRSDNVYNDARVFSAYGDRESYNVNGRSGGARPALPFSSIYRIPTNGVSGKDKDGVKYVEYGFYPQSAVARGLQQELERQFTSRRLNKTGNGYTTDSRQYDEYGEKFKAQRHEEYEYKGKRYIRVKANSCFDGGEFKLSNGESYRDGDYVWVEVEPIKWLVSEKDKLMLAEKIVFAGVQFKHERDYHTKDFGKTDIKKFIDECWSKDIEQVLNEKSKENENGQEKGKIKKTRLQKLRPKQGEEDIGNKDITETERIHRWIENGESVMLIGPSGIGKTERIESLYPDYIRLELSDGMLPEIVKGSVNIQTGKNIPPTYAVKAIKQMATEEEKKLIEEDIQNIYKIADDIYKRSKKEDKKIVILIDELLNVKPQIQGLVYPLVLKNIVPCGSGEEIKLPLNVVLVGTGNPEKFSSIGKEMPEPLRKRFYHVRKMEAKVGEWLTEYAIPNSVHPSVIGYIMSKYYESGKSEKKEDIQYFYEDPEVGEDNRDEYGQVGATNDPRSWTQVSDIIKNFEKDLEQGKFSQYTDRQIEEELKKGLEDKLRIEWLSSFMDFYNNPTLTPEEVVEAYTKDEEGNVKFKINQADLPQDINERFAFMTALISADEKQVKVCRDFIRKYCDPEYLATFDIAWAGKDERRARKIDELQTLDELNAKTYNGDDTRSYVRDGMEGFEAIDLAYNEHQRNEGRGGK